MGEKTLDYNYKDNSFLMEIFKEAMEAKPLIETELLKNEYKGIAGKTVDMKLGAVYAKAIQSLAVMTTKKSILDATGMGINKVVTKGASLVSITDFIGTLMNDIVYGKSKDKGRSIMALTKSGATILVDGLDLAKFFIDAKIDATKNGVTFSSKLMENCFKLEPTDPLWPKTYDLETRSISKNYGLKTAVNGEVATDSVELLNYNKLSADDLVDTGFVDKIDDLDDLSKLSGAGSSASGKLSLKSIMKAKLNRAQMKIGKMLGMADDYDTLTDFAKYDYLISKNHATSASGGASTSTGKVSKLSKFSKHLGTGLNVAGVGISGLGLGISAYDLDKAIDSGEVKPSDVTSVISSTLNMAGAIAAFAGPPGMIASAVLTTIAGVVDMTGAIGDLPEDPSAKQVIQAMGKAWAFAKMVGAGIQAEEYREAMNNADNHVDKDIYKKFYQIECLRATPLLNFFDFIYGDVMKNDAREELEEKYGNSLNDVVQGVFKDRIKSSVDAYVSKLTEVFGDNTMQFITMSSFGAAGSLYDGQLPDYAIVDYTRHGGSGEEEYKADPILKINKDSSSSSSSSSDGTIASIISGSASKDDGPKAYSKEYIKSQADRMIWLGNRPITAIVFQKAILEQLSAQYYTEFVDSGEKNVFGTSLHKKAGKAGTGVLAEYKIVTGASEVDNLVMYSLSSVIKPIFSFGSHDNTLIFNKPIIADVKHHKSIQAEADGGRGEDTINFGDIASKENQVFNMEYTFETGDNGERDKESRKHIKGGTLTLTTDYLAEESGDESKIVAKNFETFVLPSLRGAINKFVYKPGYKIGSELDGVKTLKITSSEGTKSNELNFKGADDVRIQFYGAAEKNTVDGTENDDIIVTKELEKTPERQQGSTFHGWGGDDTLVGTNVSDSLYGDDGRDIIDGKGGADKLYGGIGNDIIAAYEASKVVDGGDGIDKVDYHNASKGIELDLNTQTVKFAKRITERVYDVEYDNQKNIVSMEQAVGSAFGDKLYGFDDKTNFIMGYKGNDHIFGGNADDVLNGGEGYDELYGKDGNDNLAGKEGNDRLYGEAGNDNLYGGLGADELHGGDGDDVMFTEFLSEREHEEVDSNIYDYADGGAGNDRIYGSGKADRLIGGLGDDKLYGRGGDDQIYGGEGDDHIEDVDGKNYINAGAGDDIVYDYHGNDIVVGGDGYDYLDYTKMNDYMAEAEGSNLRDIKIDLENNKFSYNDGEAKEHGIYEFEAVIGSDMAEEIIGTEIDNNIVGNGGSDTIYARAGNDTVKGGDGDDKIFGEAGGDKLYGGLGSDEIDGGSGDDTIYGEQGDDVLVGGAGDDFMAGGIGNDELIGGAGDDKMFGGLGDDTYRFSGHDFGDDSIYDPAAGNDKIVFEGLGSDDLTFDRNGKDLVINSVREDGGRLTVSDWFAGADHKMDIVSSDGYDFTEKIRAKGLANDVIRGDEKANELYGKVGDDELHGLGGADKLYGGIGNDKLYGGDGNDELYGGDGNDNLYAGNGDVRLEGGAGNDLYHIDKDSSGHKTIYTENGANENIIMNNAAFFTSDIELEKKDDDLTITFKDKNNSAITIEDWFAGDEHKIGINEGIGGVKNQFTVSQIEKLIHDMAIFEGDSGVGVVDPQSGNTENPIGEIFNPEDNPFGEIEPC